LTRISDILVSMDVRATEFSLADAKARLSELVQRAEAGEEITIKRHGKPVAKLSAAGRPKRDVEAQLKSWREWFAYRDANNITLGPDLTIDDLLSDTRG
jgi:prevent-host-death family protein